MMSPSFNEAGIGIAPGSPNGTMFVDMIIRQ